MVNTDANLAIEHAKALKTYLAQDIQLDDKEVIQGCSYAP
jgi:hypothetical protein